MAGDGFFTGSENDKPLTSGKPKGNTSTKNDVDPDDAKNPLERMSEDAPEESKEHDSFSEEVEDIKRGTDSSDTIQETGFISKIKKMMNGMKDKKEDSKNAGLPEFLTFIKKAMKPASGKDAPPPGSEELEKKSKNKIIAIFGVVLLVLFGLKTAFEGDKSNTIAKNTKAPDAGATSLFGDYNPEIGQIKGQVVTKKDIRKEVDDATNSMMKKLRQLKEENQKLRRNEIVIAQGLVQNNETRNNAVNQQTSSKLNENTNPTEQSKNDIIAPPPLPNINDPLGNETITAPDAPMSLNPMGTTTRTTNEMNSQYPVVGQSATAPPSRSDFGVSGDKVYSYSPVTDAVKGVAGAVKGTINGKKDTNLTAGNTGINSKDPVAIVPASTIVGGVMLSGLDAPTGNGASGDPMPIVMQLMDNGTTASYFQVPIKGCRIILAGYGDLPSERVYMRLERLICIAETGEVYSASANGVVLGEDGKNGMRGRVVDKQGALIMRSMLAGMMQGVGNVFKSLQQTTLLSATTGIATTQSLSGTALGKAAIGGGLVSSSKRLADYYLKKAEQLYPIIEINAGRDVEVLFTRDLQFFPISKIVGVSPTGGTESNSGGFWDIPISIK